MNRIIFIMVAALLSLPMMMSAQNENKTLFEYPQVPDRLTKANLRADFMVEHLWDKCNLEKEEINDISAFADAFTDYLSFFVVADIDAVKKSVASFIDRLAKNKKNLDTVLGLVDELVYSPYSEYCSDELYAIFADVIANNKKINSEIRNKFTANAAKVKASKSGATFADMQIRRGEEVVNLYSLKSQVYIVIFNTDGDFDTSMYKLRLNTDIATNDLIEKSAVTVLSLYSNDSEKREGDSENWYKAEVKDMENKFDMRIRPCVYILDSQKNIIAKSPDVERLLSMLSQLGATLGL